MNTARVFGLQKYRSLSLTGTVTVCSPGNECVWRIWAGSYRSSRANGVVYITGRVMDGILGRVRTYVKVLTEGMACRECGGKRVKCNRKSA